MNTFKFGFLCCLFLFQAAFLSKEMQDKKELDIILVMTFRYKSEFVHKAVFDHWSPALNTGATLNVRW